MKPPFDSEPDFGLPVPLRLRIAAGAARLVADEGLDYGPAKQRAARELMGDTRLPRNTMPDNRELDEALREHLSLFDEDHPARLARMRAVAIELMTQLSAFHPLATGAVWKGLATEFAPIHVQLFHDNVKEVQFFLIDRHLDADALTIGHFRTGDDVEAFHFIWRSEPVLLSVYPYDDLRGALRAGPQGADRGDLAALAGLAASPEST